MGVTATKLEHRIAESTSLEVWMQDWVLDMPTKVEHSARFRSFQEVFTEAGAMLEENKDIITKNPLRSGPDYHKTLYDTLCLANAKRLLQILSQKKYNKFVIAFDECLVLNFKSMHTQSNLDMSLVALQRIIKASDQYDHSGVSMWYLLLDTNSSIFDLAPVVPNTSSSRLAPEPIPLPIWPYLGFNQMANPTHTQSIKHAADVLSLEHLKA